MPSVAEVKRGTRVPGCAEGEFEGNEYYRVGDTVYVVHGDAVLGEGPAAQHQTSCAAPQDQDPRQNQDAAPVRPDGTCAPGFMRYLMGEAALCMGLHQLDAAVLAGPYKVLAKAGVLTRKFEDLLKRENQEDAAVLQSPESITSPNLERARAQQHAIQAWFRKKQAQGGHNQDEVRELAAIMCQQARAFRALQDARAQSRAAQKEAGAPDVTAAAQALETQLAARAQRLQAWIDQRCTQLRQQQMEGVVLGAFAGFIYYSGCLHADAPLPRFPAIWAFGTGRALPPATAPDAQDDQVQMQISTFVLFHTLSGYSQGGVALDPHLDPSLRASLVETQNPYILDSLGQG